MIRAGVFRPRPPRIGGPWWSIRRRIPVRWRHHWMPVVAFAALVVVVLVWLGDMRVRPYVTGDDTATTVSSPITENITGTADLFDTSQSHEVSVSFDQGVYEDMIKTYHDTGEKDWIPADVTIDGTLITDVGIRLKGNSTLSGLDGKGGLGDRPEGGEMPQGGDMPGQGGNGQGGNLPQGQGNQQLGGMMGMGQLSSDEPETLPYLIAFDEYVEGRAFQGITGLSVRPNMGGSAMMNEAVSLALTADSGQATQRYAYSTFAVNDRPSTTRLLLEVPDESYGNALYDGNGVLYKINATADFSYHGNDQTDYEDDFTQVNRLGSEDLGPVISLLKWLDNASDDEFDQELADHVDVESFAQYAATQNLLLNFDDLSGPGRNGYLWYDLDTKTFRVISWDLNLTMNGDTSTKADDNTSMGGGMPMGQGQNGQDGQQGMPQFPGGNGGNDTVPQGMPEGAPEQMPDLPDGAEQGRGQMGGNTLKERFLDSEAFTDVYHQAYRELAETMYGDGHAVSVLERIAQAVPASDAIDQATLNTQIAQLRKTLTARAKALADDPIGSAK